MLLNIISVIGPCMQPLLCSPLVWRRGEQIIYIAVQAFNSFLIQEFCAGSKSPQAVAVAMVLLMCKSFCVVFCAVESVQCYSSKALLCFLFFCLFLSFFFFPNKICHSFLCFGGPSQNCFPFYKAWCSFKLCIILRCIFFAFILYRHKYIYIYIVVLGVKSKAQHMLSKCSATELTSAHTCPCPSAFLGLILKFYQ